jgi:cytochrome P450
MLTYPLYRSLAWIEMRMIVVALLREFDLVALAQDSTDWIERQRIFFLWERLPLRVRIQPVAGG